MRRWMKAPATKGFAICTEPRSGSNYLCQVLTSTGSLGAPLEYFNGAGRRAFDDPAYPDEPLAQLTWILTHGATANGIYGVKLFSSQFDALAHLGWISRLPGLQFVHLERRDILGQAISWVRAEQTGAYRAYSKVKGVQARYDGEAISRRMKEIVVGHARWRLFFARNAIAPLHLTYEELTKDPAAAAGQVAEFMGAPLDGPYSGDSIDLSIQSDALSGLWRRRYIAETADSDVLPLIEADRARL